MSTKNGKENKTLDLIHGIVIDLFKEFKKLCDKHSLRYFAISGTTIGAALWEGFIPWDDDMDIAMPAEDYLKFLKYARKELPKHIDTESYLWFGSKIFNKNTTFTDIHYVDMPERYCGIFIDIVPLISLPNDDTELDDFMDDFRSFTRHAIMLDRYNIVLGPNEQELKKWQKRILLRNKFGETSRVMDFSDQRYILDASGFVSPIVAKFEDTSIPMSSNWENDLHIQYGNYQKYPPKEKRISAHDNEGIFSLEDSTVESAKKYNSISKTAKRVLEKRKSIEAYYCDEMFRLKNENIILKRNIRKLKKENYWYEKNILCRIAKKTARIFVNNKN